MPVPHLASAQLLPEWCEQDAILLAWPHAETDWSPNLAAIEDTYLEIIKHTTRFQKVVLLAKNENQQKSIQSRFTASNINAANVIILCVDFNDTWLRDSGPLTVTNDEGLILLDFRFNGWGEKFNAEKDDAICRQLSQLNLFAKVHSKSLDVILEGGSVDTDGAGTLLTTRQCLLSSTRNPALKENDYEELFNQEFGISRIIWIENSELIGDDTDGHIDMLARFCSENIIAYSSCDDINDPQYISLHNMEAELARLKTVAGTPYKLLALPIPAAIYNKIGERLPASYANFLIINRAVLVPIYDDKNDAVAINVLHECFPDREIIGIDARAIIEQSGSLHCLTMQLPKGVLQI